MSIVKTIRPFTIALVSLILIAPALPASATAPRERWVKRYDRADGFDSAAAVALSADGTKAFVTGSSYRANGHSDYATLAYDTSDGSRLWVRRYDGPANNDDYALALAASPDGTALFVTGSSDTTRRNADYATIAYDAASGEKLWARRYDGPGMNWSNLDAALDLALSPAGASVFVTGFSAGSVSYDYATIAYNAATGAQLWAQRYDEAMRKDIASALTTSPDGSEVFVAGTRHSNLGDGFTTIAYDAVSGAELWRELYLSDVEGYGEASDVAVSPDGSEIVVIGRRHDIGSLDDWATIAYDAGTGARLWTKRFSGTAGFNDRAFALAMKPDGSAVFVTGYSADAPGSGDYKTLAYDTSTGARLWASRYDGPPSGDDEASSVIVSPDGRKVFVTGYSAHGTRHLDYATLAYRAATGALLWIERFDGPASGYDQATSIAVSPNGTKVVVTGGSEGLTSYDYATVAYATRV